MFSEHWLLISLAGNVEYASVCSQVFTLLQICI